MINKFSATFDAFVSVLVLPTHESVPPRPTQPYIPPEAVNWTWLRGRIHTSSSADYRKSLYRSNTPSNHPTIARQVECRAHPNTWLINADFTLQYIPRRSHLLGGHCIEIDAKQSNPFLECVMEYCFMRNRGTKISQQNNLQLLPDTLFSP